MIKYTEYPIFFNRNRVRRVYKGGYLLEKFTGGQGGDSCYPEEWIASVVEAINPENGGDQEGISRIEGTNISLKKMIENYPVQILGQKSDIGILVKYLDSAIRLPVQVHPDRAFAGKHFHSIYGKTEMWMILATREDACIYLGFKDGVTKEEFSDAIEQSIDNKDILIQFLNRIPVKTGDIYLIPGKLVHAIGAGCMILEIQEPTDFTIQPEYWCGNYFLSNQERYMGLSKEEALQCFDFTVGIREVLKFTSQTAKIIEETENYRKEIIVSQDVSKCFEVKRYSIRKKLKLKEGTSVYVILNGEGRLKGENYDRKVKKGDYFFLPENAKQNFDVVKEGIGDLEIVQCIGES